MQYGERVWGITEGSDRERALKAIERTEEFFRSLGLATRLGEAEIPDETIYEIESRFRQRIVAFGEMQNVTGSVAKEILLNCK